MQDDPTLPVVSTSGLRWIGAGVSGIVYPLDEDTVVKIAPTYDNEYATNECLQDLLIERSIYERRGPSTNVWDLMPEYADTSPQSNEVSFWKDSVNRSASIC